MSEENNSMPMDELPIDDHGINHDNILEVCESIIKRIHLDVVVKQKNLSIQELHLISSTLSSTYSLVQNILDMDDMLVQAIDEADIEYQDEEDEEDEDEDEGYANSEGSD